MAVHTTSSKPPAMSYMRSEIIVFVRRGSGQRANLHPSPGGTKPDSVGMFQTIERFCGANRNPDS